MTYHPHDDLPDDPVYPTMPGHEPSIAAVGRTATSPAEVTVTCSCGDWDFESQESAGGGVEPWGEYWEDHLTAVELGEVA